MPVAIQCMLMHVGNVVPSTTPGAIRLLICYQRPIRPFGSNPDHIARTITNFYNSTLNAYTTYNLNVNEDHAFKFILGVNRVTATTEWQSSQITSLTRHI